MFLLILTDDIIPLANWLNQLELVDIDTYKFRPTSGPGISREMCIAARRDCNVATAAVYYIILPPPPLQTASRLVCVCVCLYSYIALY